MGVETTEAGARIGRTVSIRPEGSVASKSPLPSDAPKATEGIPGREHLERLPGVAALAAGDELGGYEVIRLLGRGGMGEVYLARDPKLGRRVAIKRVNNADPAFAERFLLEARATARCNHENIVVIHEVNEHDGYPFMVLEYLEGETLASIAERGVLSPARAVELMIPVARALIHAHSFGIVHRDLKAQNIFVTESGTVKVLDFGIAHAIGYDFDAPDETSTFGPGMERLTAGDVALGTPPFMAPEQFRNNDVDQRSDIWAAGIQLYELIQGHHPLGQDVRREQYRASAHKISGSLYDEAKPLAADEAVQDIVRICLSYDREDRFESAQELLKALEATRRLAEPTELLDDESPYPGLRPFDADLAHRFFGRETDIRRTRTRLQDEPLVALMGPSGAGKSSLVFAGLAPRLERAGENWEVVSLRPGKDPLARLIEVAKRLAPESANVPTKAQLTEEPGAFGQVLRRRARATGRSVALLVDQLEELYTLSPDEQVRGTVTACLKAAADDVDSPVRVIVTMRSDFMDHAAEDGPFLELLTRGLVYVPPLHRNGLRDALVRPAELCGYGFENETLVDNMLDELASAPVPLPLLQFAAARLWDERDRERGLLSAASYQQMGGLAGALAGHADQILREIPADAQADVRRMFQRLVTPERTRSVSPTSELVASTKHPERAQKLIDRLVAERLLVVRAEDDEPTVEIVHESLITRWPTLAQWIAMAEDDVAFVDQLRTTARQWETRGRPPGLLWRDSALGEARQWRKRNPDTELPPRERAYLDAVFALDDDAKHRRRRWLIGVAAAMLSVAAAIVIALVLINGAERERRLAAEDARDQANRALTAQERANRERQAAVMERSRRVEAESTAQTASADLEDSEEELAATNVQLERALAVQEREANRARREADRARQAERALEADRQELQRLLQSQNRRVVELERQMRRISTDLR